MRYSDPIYFDYQTNALVNPDYSPFKTTRNAPVPNSLHGGQYERNDPHSEQQQDDSDFFTETKKADKYRGTALDNDLTIPGFQKFKTEWIACLSIHPLMPNEQKKEQLVTRALKGRAKLLATMKEGFATADHNQIFKFLENQISANLGVRGAAGIVKKMQQDTNQSYLNQFIFRP